MPPITKITHPINAEFLNSANQWLQKENVPGDCREAWIGNKRKTSILQVVVDDIADKMTH